LHTYLIPVRNEFTGEERIVEIESAYDVDAQIAALRAVFDEHGWRKATAMLPQPATETAFS
jgi:hypothetical protein